MKPQRITEDNMSPAEREVERKMGQITIKLQRDSIDRLTYELSQVHEERRTQNEVIAALRVDPAHYAKLRLNDELKQVKSERDQAQQRVSDLERTISAIYTWTA